MSVLAVLRWILLWTLVTATAYAVYKVAYNLIKKPNLRYYVIKSIKDIKHMYYRYHV